MSGALVGQWQAITPARIEWRDDTPYAPAFADHYCSLRQGTDESRHVFLDGNRLPQRFAAIQRGQTFCIGETGFGTGLNLLLAAALFRALAPASAWLQLLSTELHPLSPADLQHALHHWQAALDPDLSSALLQQYPPPAAGLHRLQLAENIQLTLALGDAADMLAGIDGHCRVDAWFLDGFAPDRNPDMWSARLCQQLARLSTTGTTLASYTVAGSVRRALKQAGFVIDKAAGFGRKRECLRGYRPGVAASAAPEQRLWQCGLAAVIGAGLAGATTARALAERGWQVTVLDPTGIASAASGNRVGVVHATPAATWSPQSRFYLHSYLVALRWLRQHRAEALDIAALNGVVQHVAHERQQHKLSVALESGIWPPQLLQRLNEQSFLLPHAGWVKPQAWCRLLLDHPAIKLQRQAVTGWKLSSQRPQLQLVDGKVFAADALVFCTGASTLALPGLQQLPLQVVRGQVSEVAATEASCQWQQVQCQAGYLTPAIDGVHSVGASYQPIADTDELVALLTSAAPGSSASLTSNHADDQYNLDTLRQHLPSQWQALGGDRIRLLPSRSGLRCRAADYLPVLGPLPQQPGIWLNTAHGSRGISSTPLCAELLADQLSGLLPAADTELMQALSVERLYWDG